jgi:intein/homing endonuclease
MKMIKKELIGVKKIFKLEVEETPNTELSNSFIGEGGIVHHNCNG